MKPSKLLQSQGAVLMPNSAGIHLVFQSLFTRPCKQVDTYGLQFPSATLSHLCTVHVNSLIQTQRDSKQLKLRQYT